MVSITACRICAKQESNPPPISVGVHADKIWPPSDVLKGYRQASTLYDSGKIDEGIALVRQLVDKPLRLAPDSVIQGDSDRYYRCYLGDRVMPTLGMLRNIQRINYERAQDLSKTGDHKAALELLMLNISILRQQANLQPADFTGLAFAGAWEEWWQEINLELIAIGDKDLAQVAIQCRIRSSNFTNKRLSPFADKFLRNYSNLEKKYKDKKYSEADKIFRQYRIKEQPKVQRLVNLWNKEVDTPECKRIEDVIRKMGGPGDETK